VNHILYWRGQILQVCYPPQIESIDFAYTLPYNLKKHKSKGGLIKMIDLKGKKIDLYMTPEEQARIKDRANLSYPFIDVLDFQAALAWMIFDSEGKTSRIERMSDQDQEELGITYDMLLAAIEEVGGAINRSGQYPISDEIIHKLRRIHAVEV
jgi:hypothetical protein